VVQHRYEIPASRGFPDSNGLRKPIPIVDGVDDRRVVNAERVNNAHGSQAVDADGRLVVNIEDFLLAVDLVGTVADRAVVIDEEAVQARSEHEDVTRLCNVQAPRSLLATGECGIFPLQKGGIEGPWRRRVWLEIGRLGLREAEVMIRRSGEVVIEKNVMLGARPYEPDRTVRFRQQTSGGIDRRLVSVQGLKVMVCEPDPRAFEVTVRSRSKMDGQERCKTVAVSYRVFWTLGDL